MRTNFLIGLCCLVLAVEFAKADSNNINWAIELKDAMEILAKAKVQIATAVDGLKKLNKTNPKPLANIRGVIDSNEELNELKAVAGKPLKQGCLQVYHEKVNSTLNEINQRMETALKATIKLYEQELARISYDVTSVDEDLTDNGYGYIKKCATDSENCAILLGKSALKGAFSSSESVIDFLNLEKFNIIYIAQTELVIENSIIPAMKKCLDA